MPTTAASTYNTSSKVPIEVALGTIYQATNARYLGRSSARTLHLLPNGRVFSPRAMSKLRCGRRGWRYTTRLLVEAGAPEPTCLRAGKADPDELAAWLDEQARRILRRRRHHGNHKYGWALGGARLEKNPNRYPKALDALQLSLCA